MLEYLREMAKEDKLFRVGQEEKNFFTVLKIVCEGGWLLNSETEFFHFLDMLQIDTEPSS